MGAEKRFVSQPILGSRKVDSRSILVGNLAMHLIVSENERS